MCEPYRDFLWKDGHYTISKGYHPENVLYRVSVSNLIRLEDAMLIHVYKYVKCRPMIGIMLFMQAFSAHITQTFQILLIENDSKYSLFCTYQ